jgi:putative membrane protein
MMNIMSNGWGMWIGYIIGLTIIVVNIWLLIKFVKKGSKHSPRTHKSSIHYLRERFARGEIGLEEYERIKRILYNS